ncbi:MAG: molybdopterin-dependent oxidoreductase [Sulfolobales archaeon]
MHIDYCYETSNKGLQSKNISRVIDCPVRDLEVDSVSDIRDFIHTILDVFDILSATIYFESSEFIGYTHTLHKFRLYLKDQSYISVRVVVRDRKIKRVLFTIPQNMSIGIKKRIATYDPSRDLITKNDIGRTRTTSPPGQVYIDIPIVYAILGVPSINVSEWTLRVEGSVARRISLTLPELYELGVEELVTDLHCVTGWSVKNMRYAGVAMKRIIDLVKPEEDSSWVYIESLDGYSTIFPYEEVLESKALIALEMNGEPLDILHGYPARLVVPHLYGWKSAKWIYRISFLKEYRDGYWEALGYHPRGRVFLEERFKSY